jgi:hypothetical protein
MQKKDTCGELCVPCGQVHCGIRPKQCEVARRLFEKMKKTLKDNKFSDFEVLILVPNLNSLYSQTISRLRAFIDQQLHSKPSFLGGRRDAGRVFKANLKGEPGKLIREVEERIKKKTDVLFLLIHDECHYEATPTGAPNAFLNNDTVLKAENVLMLLVSATPYNLVTLDSRIPPKNVVNWMRNETETGNGEYFGLVQYADRSVRRYKDIKNSGISAITTGYIAKDEGFEARCLDKEGSKRRSKNGAKATVSDITRCDLLAKDYAEALQQHTEIAVQEGVDAYDNTQCIVKSLLSDRGCMVLVRVTCKDLGKRFAKQIRTGRADANLQGKFAILVDTAETAKRRLASLLEQDSPTLYKELLLRDQEKYRDLNRPPEAYEDLLDVPCILILCEKGKMGDTFPK